MKSIVLAVALLTIAVGFGGVAQAAWHPKPGKNTIKPCGTQLMETENSKNTSQSQTGRDNKQSMNVKNGTNVSQSQSGARNEQTMNVENASNVSQNQSGWFNRQSMNIGGSSGDSNDK